MTKQKPQVKLADVKRYAAHYLKNSGTNDPLLFLWALGIEIIRPDGSVVGQEARLT